MKTKYFIILFTVFAYAISSQTKEKPVEKISYYSGTQKIKEKGEVLNYKRSGVWIEYYESGAKKSITTYVNGLREGKFQSFFETGSVKSEGYYKNDLLHGKFNFYYENKKVKQKCEFNNGKYVGVSIDYFANGKKKCETKASINGLSGDSKCWYENGKLESETKYKDSLLNGIFIQYYMNGAKKSEETIERGYTSVRITYDSTGKKIKEEKFDNSKNGFIPTGTNDYTSFEKIEPEIFVYVPEMPEYEGGTAALDKYISENNTLKDSTKTNGKKGKTFVRFVVNSDGTIGKVEIQRGVPGCPECDKEAVRLVKSFPLFKPGKNNGVPVNVWFYKPIPFGYGEK